MPITVGTGPGQYPPTIRYITNGEPADDITFNRPHQDSDARLEALRAYVDTLDIADIAGLVAALNGAAPLNPNLGAIASLVYTANPNTLFAIDSLGQLTLVPNNIQGEANTASNVGVGEGQLFKLKDTLDLQFRTLKAGTNVTIATVGDEVTVTSQPGEIIRLTKYCKNTTGVTIPAGKAVAWLDDGSIALADANEHDVSDICGITAEDILDGQFGLVIKLGNVAGVLSGMGASPGQYVYLGENPGEVSLAAPSGLNDVVLALGRAEPPNGSLTGETSDLFLQPSYVSEGGVA